MTAERATTIAIACIPLILGVLAWVGARRQNRSAANLSDAQTTEILTRTNLSLLDPLYARVAYLERKVSRMQDLLDQHGIPYSDPPATPAA